MNKKILTIIQARSGSKRFPNKMLKPVINSKTVLECILERLQSLTKRTEFYVATSKKNQDQEIVKICEKNNIKVFCDSETNVLQRFYRLSQKIEDAKIVVRLCADSPFHDTDIVNKGIDFFLKNNYDYISNLDFRNYPLGTMVEVMTKKALTMAYQNATLDFEKEHVTPYIRNNTNQFNIGHFSNEIDLFHHRWTLDYEEDYKMMCEVYKELYPKNPNFKMMDVVKLLDNRPDIYEITAHLPRDK
ncbi:MAG: glycosyltransferase family protein [bacterium]